MPDDSGPGPRSDDQPPDALTAPATTRTAPPGLWRRLRLLLRPKNGSEELRTALDELIARLDGEPLGANELTLLRNILNLRHLNAYDVAVPRVDIVAIDIDTPLGDIVRKMSETAHSRLPVYRETLDDVVGMIHIKDVLACWDGEEPFRIQSVLRPLLFVAPSMPILELLLQMRVKRIHMALLVDEFGGTDGLITIEDLVEEIVGEIADEHEVADAPTIVERADGTLEADARVEIEDFETRVGPVLTPEEREEDIDTLGGLVVFLTGRVPARGEVVRHPSGLEIEVLDADPRRVKRLRIAALPHPPGQE